MTEDKALQEEPISFPEPSPYTRSDKMKDIVAMLDANQESLFNMIRKAEQCAYEWMVRHDRLVAALRKHIEAEREACIQAARESVRKSRMGDRWLQYDQADVEAAIRSHKSQT